MDKLKKKVVDLIALISNNKWVLNVLSIQKNKYRIWISIGLLMILGFFYTLFAKIPLVTYVLPWGYGYLAGYLGWYAVKNFKNDWFLLKAVTAISATIVAMYFNWIFFIKDEYDVLLIWPFTILSALGEVAESRTINIVTSTSHSITGIWLMLCWLLELILVFIGCWHALTKIFDKNYLCLTCKEWSSDLFESTELENSLTSDQIQAINSKDFSPIEQLRPLEDGNVFYTYLLQRCEKCRSPLKSCFF